MSQIEYNGKVLRQESPKFQEQVAIALVREMRQDAEIGEIDASFILDMMGVLGVEFAVGDKASIAFFGALK